VTGSTEPEAAAGIRTGGREGVIRLGYLLAGGCLLQAGLLAGQNRAVLFSFPLLLASCLAYAAAVGMFFMALRRARPGAGQWLLLGGILLAVVTQAAVRLLSTVPGEMGTDSALFSAYAADLVLLGENPYQHDMQAAYHVYRVTNFFMTPLLDGGTSSALPYPALHFLLLAPFKLAGLADPRWLYLLAHLALLMGLFLAVPRTLRGVAVAAVALFPAYLEYTLGWVSDVVWVALLAGMAAAWKRPIWRAILFGLACAYKQTPWLLAPFIVVRLLLDDDSDPQPPLQRLGRFVLWAEAAFLAVNLPFIAANPASWWRGVSEPLTAPMIYFGSGLSRLSQLGMLPLSKTFYTLAALVTLAALLAIYALRFPQIRHTLWFLPGIVLWFSYRSLQSYFVYWLPLMVIALGHLLADLPSGSGLSRWRRRASWGVAGAALAVLSGLLVIFGRVEPSVRVEVLDVPPLSDPYRVRSLDIRVGNLSRQAITPQVAVARPDWQPYPWVIERGPAQLAPGESAVYRVTTDVPYRTISLADGALVVVTGGGADYTLRGTAALAPDPSLLDPGQVYNTGYLLGEYPEGVPLGWSWEGGVSGVQVASAAEGFRAVRLEARPSDDGRWSVSSLSQQVLFLPGIYEVWVHPPSEMGRSGQPLTQAYGVAFEDGVHTLWVVFGPDEGESAFSPDHIVLMRPAPLETWSRQIVDLAAEYRRLGWEPPPFRRVVIGQIEMVTQVVTLRLMVGAQETEGISGQFGPITFTPASDGLRQQAASLIQDESAYYLALSELAALSGRDQTAALYYAAAVQASSEEEMLLPAEEMAGLLPPRAVVVLSRGASAYLQASAALRDAGLVLFAWDTEHGRFQELYRLQGLPEDTAYRLADRDTAAALSALINAGHSAYCLDRCGELAGFFTLAPFYGALQQVTIP
jgi:hypothetical protein